MPIVHYYQGRPASRAAKRTGGNQHPRSRVRQPLGSLGSQLLTSSSQTLTTSKKAMHQQPDW